MTSKKLIADWNLTDANEKWTLVVKNGKTANHTAWFKVDGLDCEFEVRNSCLADNGDGTVTFYVNNREEPGDEISWLLDSLLCVHSDKIKKYEWEQNGTWYENEGANLDDEE